MFVIIWKYEVDAEHEEEFARVYGPDGDWATFFRKSSGYLGSELREPETPGGGFETTDRWVSRAAFESFKREHRAEYEALDARCESLTANEVKVGEHEVRT